MTARQFQPPPPELPPHIAAICDDVRRIVDLEAVEKLLRYGVQDCQPADHTDREDDA